MQKNGLVDSLWEVASFSSVPLGPGRTNRNIPGGMAFKFMISKISSQALELGVCGLEIP